MRLHLRFWLAIAIVGACGTPAPGVCAEKPFAVVRGQVVAADGSTPLAARIYVQGDDGSWHFPESVGGTAVQYRKSRPNHPPSVEMHTTLSAQPFTIQLPAGKYTFTIERGKEFHSEARMVAVADEPLDLTIRLRRWIDMGQRGWFSGDTHVHRGLDELPNLLLAEDLNVALPLLDWTREAFVSPLAARKESFQDAAPQSVYLDPSHVYYPRNTEYELFTVNKKPHTLGACFALNHRTVLDVGAPPVKTIAERIHAEGGLIELDKHNWPWSMMLIPIMQPDLYELSNNHVWRTEFAFRGWGEPAPAYMQTERDEAGFTEWGWLDYGFQNYYALLNCGFRLRPTAGTASGVHPVPLGFGRVYVHCPDGFNYESWLQGLNAGRSFVTTGPMLMATVDGQPPGHTFPLADSAKREFRLQGSAISEQPLDRVQILVNGEIVRTVRPQNEKTRDGAHESQIDERITIDRSSWIAVRCFEARPDKRIRFAHSAPFHIDMPGKPLRPRKAEIDFLIQRVSEQLARNEGVLPAAALAEYRAALAAYQAIAAAGEH